MNFPIRLVIVDDHEMIRQTWTMVLQRDNRIQVIAECASGDEAIACAAKENPDIILMDINMHPVNGFEATRVILETNPAVKIIGTSISDQPAYARKLIKAGAKGFVTKNSPAAEMIEAIITVCNGGTYLCHEMSRKTEGWSIN